MLDPLEITEEGLEKFRLFSPLIANLNMRGIAEGELYGSDLVQYLEIIEEAIEREECEGEEVRGLMHYFRGKQGSGSESSIGTSQGS